MNFLSKLFGRKNQAAFPQQPGEKEAGQEKGKPFFTNAPAHWGIITDEFLASNSDFTENYDEQKGEDIFAKRMSMLNSLVLLGSINRSLSASTGKKVTASYADSFSDSNERYATSSSIDLVFGNVAVRTNGIVIDDFEKYAVFLFEKPTPIAYINKLKETFIANGFKDLIYYCTENPETVS